MWDLPGSGMELCPLNWQAGFIFIVPPGKSCPPLYCLYWWSLLSLNHLGVLTVFPVLVEEEDPVLWEAWSFLQTKPWKGDQLVSISALLSSITWICRIPWFICSQLEINLGSGDKLVWNPTAGGPILGPSLTSPWLCEPNSLSLILSYQSNANKTSTYLPGPLALCL